MKRLFDHNLSQKLVRRLADLFPGSTQTSLLGYSTVADVIIWDYAKANGFVVVTLDKDFAGLAVWRGSPPKVIWLRGGNSTVTEIERLPRSNVLNIQIFETHPAASVLEIWP